MKNLFLLPTDKPSRLHLWIDDKGSRLELCELEYSHTRNAQNIYITSDEEIKKGDWVYSEARKTLFKVKSICNTSAGYLLIEDDVIMPLEINEVDCKKIILTTDQDLIKDGVQSIDDEFLEWFVKNPSCEEVEVKHKEVIQYGNMTMYDHNGDGSHYFCKDCEVETSRSKEELLKFGVEYYKIIIPKKEPKQDVFNYLLNAFKVPKEYFGKEEPKQENCCTPIGQIKRYVDCKGCDRKPKQETLEEAVEIDLTNLCYYDKRNPDCTADDEDIEDHKKSLLKKNKTCSCDNCFYGRTELTEQLIWQKEKSYSEEEMLNFAWFLLRNVGQYSDDRIAHFEGKYLEQFKKK